MEVGGRGIGGVGISSTVEGVVGFECLEAGGDVATKVLRPQWVGITLKLVPSHVTSGLRHRRR